MKKNMGSVDRVIRVLIVVAVGVLFATGQIEGILAIILFAISGVFLLTSFISFCPIYAAIGLKSCKLDESGNCK